MMTMDEGRFNLAELPVAYLYRGFRKCRALLMIYIHTEGVRSFNSNSWKKIRAGTAQGVCGGEGGGGEGEGALKQVEEKQVGWESNLRHQFFLRPTSPPITIHGNITHSPIITSHPPTSNANT
jgi:hypothetical protein